jgi:cysteine desulfurase
MLQRLKNLIASLRTENRVYLDHAAAPIPDRRIITMRNVAEKFFGNPGSVHEEGRRAKASLEEARAGVAEVLSVKKDEILFTSGGTESNNLAILGFARHLKREQGSLTNFHFITSAIEHPSVLECFKEIELEGGKVTYLSPDPEGYIPVPTLVDAITDKTVFVSLGYVHGEIGVVLPIRALARAAREKKASLTEVPLIIHTDASQASLYFDLTPHTLSVDLMTLDAMKARGPKGTGVLFKKHSVRLRPILLGGGQEFELRAGTENVGAAHASWHALRFAREGRKERHAQVSRIQEYCFAKIRAEFPQSIVNGGLRDRTPANINISILGIDAEYAVVILDGYGIASGTRSACMSPDGGGSDVVRIISGDDRRAQSSLRFTIGPETTRSDIDRMIGALKNAVREASKV